MNLFNLAYELMKNEINFEYIANAKGYYKNKFVIHFDLFNLEICNEFRSEFCIRKNGNADEEEVLNLEDTIKYLKEIIGS